MADVMELIKQHEADMIGIRRHIHANPELSNEENRTTALIREKLEEYGIEIMEIGLKTGFLKGGRPGKTVAIREDIDALPMSEKTGLPYASSVDGVCHSCGHDIHTTVLLFCARVLSELRDQLSGNVLFLFQPAEERGTGARQLLDCKFYEPVKPDVLVGLHVSPEYPAGSIGLKEGPANASCDTFYIKVSGKGGHGAHPENCIDPIAISGYIMAQLQTVVSRENHPVYPAVMTIGSIHGGKAPNVIPDFVEMTREQPVELRFIELMPMGPGAEFGDSAYLPGQTVLDRVPELKPLPGDGGVARLYQLPGAAGRVGLISPLSRHFCGSCNRLRLTAEGALKPCLHSSQEIPLRGLHGAALREAMENAIWAKPKMHGALDAHHSSEAGRNMNTIGG